MKKHVLIYGVLLAGLFALGCSEGKKAATLDIGSTDPDAPTIVVDVDGVPYGALLYFKVGLAWEYESVSNYTFSSPCYVPAGSALGTRVPCTLTFPEAKLFYSHVKFRVGSLEATSCSRLVFQPYYFQRSNIMVADAWDPDVVQAECSKNPTNPADQKCWGGAAPILMKEQWPKNKSKYFVPTVGNQMDYIVESSNSTRQLGYGVNWTITNDLTDTSGRATTPTPPLTIIGRTDRIGGTWVDYQVRCEDLWGELQYAIDIVISDENTLNSVNGTVEDTFTDWDNTP